MQIERRKVTMRTLATLILAVIMASSLAAALACGGGEEAGSPAATTPSGEATPGATATPASSPPATGGDLSAELMAAVSSIPVEWDVSRYLDLAACRQDPRLRQFYDEASQGVSERLQEKGIDFDQVDSLALASGHGAIYWGHFELARIRAALQALDFDQSSYLDTDLWTGPEGLNSVVVLVSAGNIIFATDRSEAELALSVIKGWGMSVYDDESVSDVLGRLPADPVRLDITLGAYSGLLVTASAIEKKDTGGLVMSTLAKFDGDGSAKGGVTQVAQHFNNWSRTWGPTNVETLQIRQYVMSTGQADLAEAQNLLGYWTYWVY
jgi:hypothetical protein